MKEQVTYWIDDLSGKRGEDVKTRLFGLDGYEYEIDLSDANKEKLDAALAKYVDKARRRRLTSKPSKPAKGRNSESAKIRAWCAKNGVAVNPRGRISADVLEKYHQDA